VLIGFADALAAPEAVFSLLGAGHRVRVFARENTRPLVARRLPVGAPVLIPAPERDAAGAVAALRRAVAGDPAIAVVLALDDTALWLVDAAFGADGGGRPLLANASGPQAAFALDKVAQIAAAQAAGFDVPPTRILSAPGDADGIEDFPCIVRSARALQESGEGLRKGGACYLMSAADRGRAGGGDVLFPALAQPLIAGTGEGLFGFASAGGVTAWSAHERVRMMNPHGSGASACRARPADPDLCERAARLVASVGWRGPFMVELLRDAAGRAWFMEFNGRLWGSTALARRVGLEYPAWAVAQALAPGFVPDPPPAPPGEVAVRHLGREILHLAFVLRGPKSAFHKARWPSFIRSAAGALRPGRGRGFYNHDPAYPWYFLHDAAHTVAAFLGKRR
jgi:hypothetical protein